jgi:hypothetical protein
VEKIVPNLHFIRNRALLKELVLYNPDINVDRLRALGMVMLYREAKLIENGGNFSETSIRRVYGSDLAQDDYFTRNYDRR